MQEMGDAYFSSRTQRFDFNIHIRQIQNWSIDASSIIINAIHGWAGVNYALGNSNNGIAEGIDSQRIKLPNAMSGDIRAPIFHLKIDRHPPR